MTRDFSATSYTGRWPRRLIERAATLFRQDSRSGVRDRGTLGGLTQFAGRSMSRGRKWLILKRRDVRVVEGARLEIALTVCDGVLQISITVADPET
jgi:hypothetical protein